MATRIEKCIPPHTHPNVLLVVTNEKEEGRINQRLPRKNFNDRLRRCVNMNLLSLLTMIDDNETMMNNGMNLLLERVIE